VLSIGGKVIVADDNWTWHEIRAAKDLPVGVRLQGLNVVLRQAPIGDDAVERLQPLAKQLTNLDLQLTQVSDAGLARLKTLTNVRDLRLDGTRITGPGLAHLKPLKDLSFLYLCGTQIGDEGLRHLKDLPYLWSLHLSGCNISDTALTHVKELSKLGDLFLDGTNITNAGLTHIKLMTHLVALGLQQTGVTDAGLEHLASLKRLLQLNLKATKVTGDGVKKLATALPGCKITWDGGTVEAKTFPDRQRQAVEQVLWWGGKIGINNGDTYREFTSAKDLPGGPLLVTRVELRKRQILNIELNCLAPLTQVTHLELHSPYVNDAGLVHLKALAKLAELDLSGTQVSDAGLRHCAEMRSLKLLNLRGTKVTAEGAAALHKALPGCKIVWDGGITEPSTSSDAERRAGEWVLSVGGKVTIGMRKEGTVSSRTSILRTRVSAFSSSYSANGAPRFCKRWRRSCQVVASNKRIVPNSSVSMPVRT
jgi:hypothetical protein